MNQTKTATHTPGPQFDGNYWNLHIEYRHNETGEVLEDAPEISDGAYGQTDDPEKARQHLAEIERMIQSHDDLLAALKYAVVAWESYLENPDEIGCDLEAIVVEGRAAIARAKGGAA